MSFHVYASVLTSRRWSTIELVDFIFTGILEVGIVIVSVWAVYLTGSDSC